MSIAKGYLKEYSRGAKSFKAILITDEKSHNYYAKDLVLDEFVGKEVEIAYHDSEPYDFKGKKVTSRWIDSIIILNNTVNAPLKPSGSTNVPYAENKGNNGLNGTQNESVAYSDDIKNRGICLSYAKDLVCQGKVELKDLYTKADELLGYLNTGAQPIPF